MRQHGYCKDSDCRPPNTDRSSRAPALMRKRGCPKRLSCQESRKVTLHVVTPPALVALLALSQGEVRARLLAAARQATRGVLRCVKPLALCTPLASALREERADLRATPCAHVRRGTATRSRVKPLTSGALLALPHLEVRANLGSPATFAAEG